MNDYDEILDEELVPEEDYTIETMKFRKKLRFRTFIAFIVVSLFFILRNFDPNIDFNNVNAPVFLFINVFVLIFCTFIYFMDQNVKPIEYSLEMTFKKYKVLNDIIDLISVVPYLSLFLTMLNMFFLSLSPITGTSMMPNYTDDEAVIFSHLYDEYERFDVVIVHQDVNDSPYLIKRVVGLPGETVKIANNKVYINDVLLNEDFIDSSVVETFCTNSSIGEYTDKFNCSFEVASDSYFVLGDNRDGGYTNSGASIDSRYLGAISTDEIYGKVIYKFKDYNLIK